MQASKNLLQVTVANKTSEAVGICSLELIASNGQKLPAFSAGSHIDVHLPGGVIRQYSLCNSPSDNSRYVIAVLLEVNSRGGSKAVHESVYVGLTLTISEPRNHFALDESAEKSVLLAGGIGITPIIGMAERLTTIGATFQMHYAARSLDRTAFKNRIDVAEFSKSVSFHIDDGSRSQRLNLNSLLSVPCAGTHIYACGPRGFIDAVMSTAKASGWRESQLHCEFFAGEVPAQKPGDGSFEVQLSRSGKLIQVAAAETVVQALHKFGVEISVSCEQGVCGTCLTTVLQGEVDHRDSFLTPQERAKNNQFTPCCSRAKSGVLVLDV
jgi:vanillate O-demethylase ferredoxin subunit